MSRELSYAWLRLRDAILSNTIVEGEQIQTFAFAQGLTNPEVETLIDLGYDLLDELSSLEFVSFERKFDNDGCEFFVVKADNGDVLLMGERNYAIAMQVAKRFDVQTLDVWEG